MINRQVEEEIGFYEQQAELVSNFISNRIEWRKIQGVKSCK